MPTHGNEFYLRVFKAISHEKMCPANKYLLFIMGINHHEEFETLDKLRVQFVNLEIIPLAFRVALN